MNRLRLDSLRHLAVPAALLAMVAFNVLAVTLPLGGRATGEVSAMFQNLFTPAGWAFSIWSVIYIGLAAFTLYQFLPSQADDRVAHQVAILFTVSSLLNLSWLLAWHFLWIGLSMVIMLALVITVALIYLRVTSRKVDRTLAHRLMVALPFRLYLGWLIVATLANLAALLTARGWDWAPFGETGFALVLVGVAAIVGLLALLLKRDHFVILPVAWGLVAVATAPGQPTVLLIGGLLAAALLLAIAIWQIWRRRQPPHGQGSAQTPLTPGR